MDLQFFWLLCGRRMDFKGEGIKKTSLGDMTPQAKVVAE